MLLAGLDCCGVLSIHSGSLDFNKNACTLSLRVSFSPLREGAQITIQPKNTGHIAVSQTNAQPALLTGHSSRPILSPCHGIASTLEQPECRQVVLMRRKCCAFMPPSERAAQLPPSSDSLHSTKRECGIEHKGNGSQQYSQPLFTVRSM
jgi:hypothetical protein